MCLTPKIQESPRQTKPKKGRFASRFANLGCFREFGVFFFPGKKGEFTKTPSNDFCEFSLFSPCRKRSPAKGVWQKGDEKSHKSVRKSDRKVTESVPKTKKSDRTPFAAVLLRHPDVFPAKTLPNSRKRPKFANRLANGPFFSLVCRGDPPPLLKNVIFPIFRFDLVAGITPQVIPCQPIPPKFRG